MDLLSQAPHPPCIALRTRAQTMSHSDCSDDTEATTATFYPAERKRAESHLSFLRPCAKRIRHEEIVRHTTIVEHLTPEVSLIPRINLRTYGPFFPGQFEDGTVHVVKMKESDLVDSISVILSNICLQNQTANLQAIPALMMRPPYRSEKYPDGSSSVFFSLTKPQIVLKTYITRFVRYLNVSRSVFIVGLIYLDRVCADDNMLALTELNMHRLITAALCAAAKFLEDESHRNSCLSKIGGVPSTAEMNILETQFMRRLRWDCSVSMNTYQLYEEGVLRKSFSIMR